MKKICILLIVLFSFVAFAQSVHATSTIINADKVEYLANNSTSGNQPNCKEGYLGSVTDSKDPAYYLQTILDIMKYLGIVLCIVLTCYDFFKALFSEDNDAMKPLVKKAFIRLFFVVTLFFLPIIVKVIMSFVGAYDTCGIS